jgi:hypothetical protein
MVVTGGGDEPGEKAGEEILVRGRVLEPETLVPVDAPVERGDETRSCKPPPRRRIVLEAQVPAKRQESEVVEEIVVVLTAVMEQPASMDT